METDEPEVKVRSKTFAVSSGTRAFLSRALETMGAALTIATLFALASVGFWEADAYSSVAVSPEWKKKAHELASAFFILPFVLGSSILLILLLVGVTQYVLRRRKSKPCLVSRRIFTIALASSAAVAFLGWCVQTVFWTNSALSSFGLLLTGAGIVIPIFAIRALTTRYSAKHVVALAVGVCAGVCLLAAPYGYEPNRQTRQWEEAHAGTINRLGTDLLTVAFYDEPLDESFYTQREACNQLAMDYKSLSTDPKLDAGTDQALTRLSANVSHVTDSCESREIVKAKLRELLQSDDAQQFEGAAAVHWRFPFVNR